MQEHKKREKPSNQLEKQHHALLRNLYDVLQLI